MDDPFQKLLRLIDDGQVIQIEKTAKRGYEISVWKSPKDTSKFDLFEAKELADAVMKIK